MQRKCVKCHHGLEAVCVKCKKTVYDCRCPNKASLEKFYRCPNCGHRTKNYPRPHQDSGERTTQKTRIPMRDEGITSSVIKSFPKKPERWTDRIRFIDDKKPKTLYVEYEVKLSGKRLTPYYLYAPETDAPIISMTKGELNKLRAAQAKLAVCEFCEIKDNGKEPQIWICGDCARNNEAEERAAGRAEGYFDALKDCVKEIKRIKYESLGCIDIERIGKRKGIKWVDLMSWKQQKEMKA